MQKAFRPRSMTSRGQAKCWGRRKESAILLLIHSLVKKSRIHLIYSSSRRPSKYYVRESLSCKIDFTREGTNRICEKELKDRDKLVETLQDQNKLIKNKFNKLKGVFGEHKSSRICTEGTLKSSKFSILDGTRHDIELRKAKSRAHRMSNIEEVMSKKDSIGNM